MSVILYFLVIVFSVYTMKWAEIHKNNLYGIIVSIMILSILGGCRYGIGTDFFSYEKIYNTFESTGKIEDRFIEPIFKLLMGISQKSGLNFIGFSFLIQCLTNIIFFLAIYRERKNIGISFPWFIYVCRYYFLGFNIIRQELAMAFCLLAITYFYDDLKRYVFYILLAAGIHITALMFLFFLPIRLFKLEKRVVVYRFLCVVLGGGIFAKNLIINTITKFVPRMSILGYITSADGGGSWFGYLFYIVPLLFPFLLFLKKVKLNHKFSFYLFLLIFGEILYALTLVSKNQLARISFYYLSLQIFIIPYGIRTLKLHYNIVIYKCYYSWLSVFMFCWEYLILNNGNVYPYVSILSM